LEPERDQYPGIRIVSIESPPGDSRPDDVTNEQGGQHEPERVLGRFPRRHPKRAPVVEKPERQHAVHRDGAVERERPGSAPPQDEKPPAAHGHRLERDEPEGVVGEVKRQVEQ
jgi:hypothetical protein